MAVTVASKTHEATTLVIQSDLDIIVKSSRDEVFVFAENMLTGKPWPQVRLLISNGKQVFAEGVTGTDGVFRGQFKELKDAQDVRVFAVAGASVASNVIGLQGVGVAQGLSDKGYLYSDRPAYRAGQMVHLRGCIRRAVNDAYTIEKDKKFTLEVFDGRNRLVRQEKVALGEFGSFHAHFVLPATSAQGQYRFLVRDEANRSFTGTFLVLEYALEPVRLVVDSPRRVYYRGEEIEGTIRAEFYYGAPLVGREIRYQLADDRLRTATTDAKGEVRFKLPTREFNETQVLPLVVTLPERNLQSGTNFVLACQGFSINVSTVRPVFVAGETFETTVKVTDAEGKPLAQKLVLQVLERTIVDGRVGERLVEKHELQSAGDGSAQKTLKLDKGGRYVLRAEGIDRFKNPITGQALVQVSDEEDQVRLRILADKHTFKVGDTASVQIHWREAPALALVTFQGARVLDYKLLQLAKGANKLEVPMTALLAPNFELAVAVMTDPRPARTSPLPKGEGTKKPVRRFHAASSPFVVEREMRVGVATKRKGNGKGAVWPGEEIEVTLTTTDPQGKPVAAEVSLAMIEQSLLERFGFPVPAIQDFFRGNLRQPAVRTTASITFSYRPATRPINPQLLAEADRREVAADEEASRLRAGRETRSLQMAVSPRVAVQEEEEERLGMADFDSDMSLIAGVQTESVEGLDVLVLRSANARDVQHALDLIRQVETLEDAAGSGTPGDTGRGYGARASARLSRQRQGGLGVAAGQPVKGLPAAGVQIQDGASAFGTFRGGSGRAVLGRSASGRAGAYSQDLDVGAWGEQNLAFSNGVRYVPLHSNLGLLLGDDKNADYSGRALATINASGEMQEWNFAWFNRLDRAKAEAVAAELAKAGTMLVAGVGPQETGYWNPAVVTGADGKATLTLTVPERSTAWRFVAKGITAETLAGETTSDVVVKKDLFGELKLPMAFTDGDEAEVQVAVHNDAIEKGAIEVTLKTTIGGRSTEEKKTLQVQSKGLHELVFKTSLRRPEAARDQTSGSTGTGGGTGVSPVPVGSTGKMPVPPTTAEVSAVFELTVQASPGTGVSPVPGEKALPDKPAVPPSRDVVRRAVPLLPYGMPVYATASGSATSDTTAWVEPPKDMVLEAPSLQILIGPTVERSLLDIVLGPAPWCQVESSRFASGLDAATSDLMASISLQRLLGAAREAGSPQAQSLDSRVRSSIGLLVSSQLDDGGWSWTGRGGKSDRYSSARAVWALSLARAAAYPVPDEAYNKAVGYLKSQVAATDNSDYESKAILLHGLTAAGQGDFALANRLYRERPALSAAALAYLALALADMDRKSTAGELLALIAERSLDDGSLRRKATQGSLPWSHSPAELRALVALALQKVTPKAPKAKDLVDWLLANRVGHRWAPDKATGPAALALCEWFAESRFEGEHYRLAVFVNDVQAQVLEFDQASGTQTIDVPARLLKPGKQRVNFQITGRGRYTYQCVLGGFVPADRLKSTTADWEVRRHHEPAPVELDGREIPRGFGVLEGSYTTFRNPLTQLPVGRRGQVELEIWRHVPYSTPEEQLEYLVITEPIPCGAAVIEKSVQGNFERFEIAPGAITFYVGSRRDIGRIRYELIGYLPGAYRAAPTVIRNAYRPEQLVVATPKPLTVLPLGGQSADKYQWTPQELFELGKRHFEKGDYKAAAEHLTELVEKWKLVPAVYKESVQKLLDAHLELGPPGKVVRYFEIVKEKWPAEEIPFAKIMKVGAAYHEMGEYERSYLVFRATVEGSFGRESGVPGFLESQGEFLRSVEVMGRLLQEYPPEGYAAAASYALAQRVYAKAPEAADDPKLRQQKVNRVDLVRRAWAMLEGFLTAFPDDPAADQAAFAAANALLEMKSFDQAAAACNRYAQRYPKSDLLDSYWYIIGYCHFAAGRHEQALEMCRKVAEAKRIDRQTGAETESLNKWRAIYILGQVYHSLGKAADAIREYRRVEERFGDAKEAILYFVRKAIELPEVTAVKPGAPVEVELKFRNIPSCDVKVYAIDLMKFSLLKRNLGGITQINLAGIRPQHEATLQLGDGKDYRDRTHKIPLPLKDEGAYLVVCRGEDLHASGLVLVTPLAVEVQEDAASGRVRATVKDAASGQYVHDVHVKVIGSRNPEFISGATDLRGVFVADGVRGTSTVIAQAGYPLGAARYAFFRGQADLTPQEPPAPAPAAKAEGKQPAEAAGEKAGKAEGRGKSQRGQSLDEQLLQGLEETNIRNQGKQVEQLREMYKGAPSGVPAMKAF